MPNTWIDLALDMSSSHATSLVIASNHVHSSWQERTGDENDPEIEIANNGLYIAFTGQNAFAIYCTNCSTFYQQMFEYAEAVNTALNTAEQLSTQVQQYNNMVTQGVSLPNSMFGRITQDMQRVASIYNRAQSLGRNVANLDSQFNTQFPGYKTYLQKFIQSSGKATDVMPDRYENGQRKGSITPRRRCKQRA